MSASLHRRSLSRPDYAQLVLAVVSVWGTGDLLSTFFSLRFTGVWAEANPVVRTLLAHEPLLVVALKGATALFVGLTLLEYQSAVERVPLWRLGFAGVLAVGSAVVAGNLYVAYAAAGIRGHASSVGSSTTASRGGAS